MLVALAVAAALAGSGAARADPLPAVSLDFQHFGYTHRRVADASGCRVAMTLDERVFLAHAGELGALGLLNARELPDRIDAMPDALAMSFMLQAAPSVTQALYRQDAGADTCQFTQYVTSADADGLPRTVPVFTYDFDRARFAQTDWAALTPERFTRRAPQFRFDHDFQKRLQREFYRPAP